MQILAKGFRLMIHLEGSGLWQYETVMKRNKKQHSAGADKM